MSKLIAAHVAVFNAEGKVAEKRTLAAIAFRDAAKDVKLTELKAWTGKRILEAKAALVKASPLADAYEAMTKEARAEYKKNAGKHDPMARLITSVDSTGARFSEYKRIFELAKAGDAIAEGVYNGEHSLNEALEMLANLSRDDKGENGAEGGEGGEGGDDAENVEISVEQAFASIVLSYAKKGLTVEKMSTIIAETMKESAKSAK